MPNTRAQIRTLCRIRLGDDAAPYKFTDGQVNQWINDALADYSNYFPRRAQAEIDCEAGVRAYDLPLGLRAVLRVEYPAGEDPPRLLSRLNSWELHFYDGVFYDWEATNDLALASTLTIGPSPSAGESILVDYHAPHDWLDDDDDACTVKEEHLEALLLYVRWAANQELASTESADPDPQSMAMSILELNASRAERAYRKTIQDYQRSEAESKTAAWKMDGNDRVY